MTPAQTLREAAARVREVADAATDGPWSFEHMAGPGFAVHQGEHVAVAVYASRPDAHQMATWDPPTALLVADWLDQHADDHASDICWSHDPRPEEASPCAALALAAHILGRTDD